MNVVGVLVRVLSHHLDSVPSWNLRRSRLQLIDDPEPHWNGTMTMLARWFWLSMGKDSGKYLRSRSGRFDQGHRSKYIPVGSMAELGCASCPMPTLWVSAVLTLTQSD